MSKAIFKGSELGPDKHLLECSLCGEKDRSKILIEDLGISIGMSGDDYTFCMFCWHSTDLGEKLNKLLEIGDEGLKYKDECIDYKN